MSEACARNERKGQSCQRHVQEMKERESTFLNSLGSIREELSLKMTCHSRILPIVGYSFYT